MTFYYLCAGQTVVAAGFNKPDLMRKLKYFAPGVKVEIKKGEYHRYRFNPFPTVFAQQRGKARQKVNQIGDYQSYHPPRLLKQGEFKLR